MLCWTISYLTSAAPKEQNDETVGAMIVCRTNPQARELYRLWQERFNIASKVSQHQEQQMYMAAEPMLQYGNYKPLTASLILHDEGDKQERKEYIEVQEVARDRCPHCQQKCFLLALTHHV